MSVRLISMVWDALFFYNSGTTLTLMAIADIANENGYIEPVDAFDIKKIACKARVSVDTAIEIINHLIDDQIVFRCGDGTIAIDTAVIEAIGKKFESWK